MDHIMAHQKTIQQALMSYMVGRTLTIFFKKGFSFNFHPRKYFPSVFAVFTMWLVVQLHPVVGPIMGMMALLCINVFYIKDEIVKTVFLWASVHIVLYSEFSESTFACLAVACAFTQFLRKPDSVKNFLREPRVIFGPIFVLMVCAGLRFSDMKADQTASLLTVTASVCSVLAAFLFRPDNSETMRLIFRDSNIPTSHKRRVIHGCLLFIGFLATFVKTFIVYEVNKPIHKLALVFGVLNALLYVEYKMS